MRNAEATIAQAIDSLRRQVLRRWEAIVVDDGSTDASGAIVERAAAEDGRLTLLRREHAGVSAARNAGLERARGRWIHFLDADDVMAADAYIELVDAGERGRCGGAIGGHRVISPAGAALATHSISRESIGLEEVLDRCFFLTHAHIVRREHYEGLRFDETLGGSEDLDLWLRVAARGVRWRATPGAVCDYRLRDASLSKDAERMLAGALAAIDRAAAHERAQPDARRCVSAEGLAAARQRVAFSCASQRAIAGGDDSIIAALRMIDAAGGDEPRIEIDADRLVAGAHAAVVYALGRPICFDPATRERWLGPLRSWWGALVERGIIEHASAQEAMDLLIEESVTHEDVAAWILDRCAGASSITLAGLGQNGRLLGRMALERGFAVRFRDDRFSEAPPAEADGLPGATHERMSAPPAPDSIVVLTPLRDEGLVERFGECERVIRWRVARRTLAGATLQGHRVVERISTKAESDRKEARDAAA